MNLLVILVAIATSALFAVNGYEFQSLKLDRWGSSPTPSSERIEERTFRTRLDHFRPRNQERVEFRYHINENYYDPETGPLYIYLKDYRDYSTRWIESGLMVDIARETRAALLTFDYRYFGENRPTETSSFDDLEYLSIEQILADVADFVRSVRQYIGAGQFSPIILYGSGFGGALAAWARSRYPHLIHAAWSSSGYMEPQLASYGPYDIFEYTFNINDEGHCRDLIQNAYNVVAALVQLGEGEYLSERMNLCHPVETTSEADVAALYELVARAVLAYINEYHYVGVRAFCADLDFIPGDSLNSFARWLRYVYGDEECFDHSYNTLIENHSNITWGSVGTVEGSRQWYYLQCTQIGAFLLADEATWIAGRVSLEYHLQKCEDVFGVGIDLETLTGAFNTVVQEFDQAITNVVYTNGFFDPFRYFGRIYDATAAGSVVNMDYAAQSADLRSLSPNDSSSIYLGKEEIRALIRRWSNTTERAYP